MSQVTIIVPVYKTEAYLHRCVDSILAQTFTDFELLLVDDGSPDNCGRICDEYAAKDERIRVIHQKNGGLSVARNAGIDWAFENGDSEWLSFVDSDDWIHPLYLEYLIKAAKEYSVEICVSGIIKCNEPYMADKRPEYTASVVKSSDLYKRYAKEIMNVSACGKLFHKNCFESIRFPVGKLWEDLATTYKMLLQVPTCGVVPLQLYSYLINEEGIVRRAWRPSRLDEFDAYEEQLAYFALKPEYEEIYKTLQGTYIKAISYSYFQELESDLPDDQKEHYAKVLTLKMRAALRKYKKTSGINFKENKAVYDTAFPEWMKLYWAVRGKFDRGNGGKAE